MVRGLRQRIEFWLAVREWDRMIERDPDANLCDTGRCPLCAWHTRWETPTPPSFAVDASELAHWMGRR